MLSYKSLKWNIIFGTFLLLSVILVSVVFFCRHSTNKEIAREVARYLMADSVNIKQIFDSVNSFGSEKYPWIDVYYRDGWDSITVNNQENLSKRGSTYVGVLPRKFNLPFWNGYADVNFSQLRNKYLILALPPSNYYSLNSYLIYTLDSAYIINKYKYLPFGDDYLNIPKKYCLFKYTDNWFLIIK